MSFTSATKKELTRIESDTCCQRAELSALARMNGVMQIARQRIVLDITTENAAIARRTYALIKDLYQLQAEVLVRKKVRLKK